MSDRIKEVMEAANRVTAARSRVSDIEWILKCVNERVDKNTAWTVELELEKRDSYGYNTPLVKFRVPMQMVQQQCVDDLRKAKFALYEAESAFSALTTVTP